MIKFDSQRFSKTVDEFGGASLFARSLSDAKGRHISPQQISAWMHGKASPNGENLIAISTVAKTDPVSFYSEV